MKIICSKEALLSGINIVNKAVPTRTTMPILECILIDATRDKIKLTANDMELGIETIIDGDIEEKGMVAINARTLGEIVRKLPDNRIYISTMAVNDAIETSIVCENAHFDIISQPGDEFAYLPYIKKEDPLVISQFTLKEMISQTIFSISATDNNKLMTGELFEVRMNALRIISLDGHRISMRKEYLRDEYPDLRVVVPGKTLQEVSKILPGDAKEEVEIYFTDNHIVFIFNNTMVVSRLIEGEYFKVDQMISSDYETKVVINRRELLDCIDRATLLIREADRKPVIITIEDGKMSLQIKSQLGQMNEIIDIEKAGRDLMIGFNPRFLIDILKATDEEYVTLYLMNPKSPCIMKDEDETYIYLVLPVSFSQAAR